MTAVIRIIRADGRTYAVNDPCGCAMRLNGSMEDTGRWITQLLDHATDVANGEQGGCYTPNVIRPMFRYPTRRCDDAVAVQPLGLVDNLRIVYDCHHPLTPEGHHP